MNAVLLQPFLRPGLDVLFLALNPPVQSNTNGHYFSGDQSRFYDLLFKSGLIVRAVPKSRADEIVFGGTSINYNRSTFGVIDLIGDLVQTHSAKVRVSREHVQQAVANIQRVGPRFVCVIHSKVRDALNRYAGLTRELDYGVCGAILPGCDTRFVLNYFPNGNAVPDEPKLAIFSSLRDAL
jgi:G:T/U-mismatch repair DNA glycosylase